MHKQANTEDQRSNPQASKVEQRGRQPPSMLRGFMFFPNELKGEIFRRLPNISLTLRVTCSTYPGFCFPISHAHSGNTLTPVFLTHHNTCRTHHQHTRMQRTAGACDLDLIRRSWSPRATPRQRVAAGAGHPTSPRRKPSQPRACPCTKIRLQFRQPRQRSHGIGTADLLLHPHHVMMNNTRSSAQGKAARLRFGFILDKHEALRLQSAKILTPCPHDEQVIIIQE